MYGGMPRELRRSRYGAGLVLGVTVLVSGCGGGQSDSQSDSAQVHSVVQRYQAAVVDHNGPKMCLLLSGAAKRQLASINAGKALDCISFTKLFARAVAHEPRALSRIRDARIGTPKVTGDRATVIVQEPGAGAREITLVKTQTGWRISLPPLK